MNNCHSYSPRVTNTTSVTRLDESSSWMLLLRSSCFEFMPQHNSAGWCFFGCFYSSWVMFVLWKRLVSMVKGGLVTLLQVGVLLFFLYILLWLSLSYMLLVPYVASSCRRVLPAAAYDLSLFFIFQLLWFTWLDVFHAFLSFCVPTDKSFLYVGVYRVSCPVVGLGLGGARQDKKEGPSDDVIIVSQPW